MLLVRQTLHIVTEGVRRCAPFGERQVQLLERNGVGTVAVEREVYDSTGTGLLPIQAAVISGTPTFRVLGRVDAGAPWVEIVAAGTIGWLNSISWVPFLQLEITAGAGVVRLWIGEK